MKKFLVLGASLVALSISPAYAATFLFTAPGVVLSFNLPDSPAPSFAVPGQGFIAPSTVGTFNANPQTFASITFLNASYNLQPGISGGFSYDGSVANVFNGLQLYTGSEGAPTFVNGTYALTQYSTNAPGLLVISGVAGAVPEPSVWALLIVGFGLTGAAMRRRTETAVSFA